MEHLKRFLDVRAEEGTRRQLTPLSRKELAYVELDGRKYVDFASNDYLGLSAHPALLEAAQTALERYGVGAGASRLLGDLEIYHQLEERTAAFKGTEAALVFNSGYQANVGIIPALVKRHDVIFADQLIHASLIDGALLSRAKLVRFRHNDAAHLNDLLAKDQSSYEHRLVVTESLFSMDGDFAPLAEIAALKNRYGFRLLVDEAHATGIYGRQGQGYVEALGLTDQVDFIMGTFSKALGGFGAYIAADRMAVDYLVNTARSFIYSTALPPAIIAADIAALQVIRKDASLRWKLLQNARLLREGLRKLGDRLCISGDKYITCPRILGESQIVPLVIGEVEDTVQLSAKLADRGFRVPAIRPPTVPAGKSRLRFTLSAAHTKEEIDGLLAAIGEA